MKIRKYLQSSIAVILAGLLCGCVTTTTKNGRVIPNEPSSLSKQTSKLKNSVAGLVDSVTPNDDVEPIRWDWAPAIPQSTLKSEHVAVAIAEDAVVHFAPQMNRPEFQLVNYAPRDPMSICVVNDTRVRTLADLNRAVATAEETPTKKRPVVEFTGGFAGNSPVPASVSPNDLVALAHNCVPERTPVRIVDEGNSWVLLKDDAVRCKVMLRKERTTGLIHVVTSLKVCWGASRKLPIGLAVNSEGRPLGCLSVSETLDKLYGNKEKQDIDVERRTSAFMDISEGDEFMAPVNYRVLEAKIASDQRLASIRPYPAFAIVGGYAYPGPPVLGDARALSGFMLQPRFYHADEAEHVGWVVFDGSSDPGNENFEVVIDLGSGPQKLQFRVPNVSL